jgi:hypothetical protein
MILSLEYGFIFVHVPKTAGSAVTAALRPFATTPKRSLWASAMRRLPIVEAPEKAHFRIHDTAALIRAKLSPEVYSRFHSFAVVRNPFDHAVSHYEYMKQYRSPRIAARFARMSFEAYLAQRMKGVGILDRLFVRLPDQVHFLIGPQGRLAIDRLLRFESLAADFDTLIADLGLPHTRMTERNPTRARNRARPLAAWYDATTTEMVRTLYWRDFELFGYSSAVPQSDGADHSA